jgi:hypothetical protein
LRRRGGSLTDDDLLSRLEAHFAVLAGEREAARGHLADLLALPAAQREIAARARAACQTLALAELLVERSTEAAPPAALELARLAVAVADRLEPARYGASLVHDLRARAWAQLAEARRLDGDLAGAAEALVVAEVLCEEGSADPLEEGHLLERRAALLADQGDAEAAAALLSLAAEIYESVADAPRSARARLTASELWALARRAKAVG